MALPNTGGREKLERAGPSQEGSGLDREGEEHTASSMEGLGVLGRAQTCRRAVWRKWR